MFTFRDLKLTDTDPTIETDEFVASETGWAKEHMAGLGELKRGSCLVMLRKAKNIPSLNSGRGLSLSR